MTYSPTITSTSPATVMSRPSTSYPYSMHPFSPGPDRVQVDETNVPAIRLTPPTNADAIGIQNLQSNRRRGRSLSRFERPAVRNSPPVGTGQTTLEGFGRFFPKET